MAFFRRTSDVIPSVDLVARGRDVVALERPVVGHLDDRIVAVVPFGAQRPAHDRVHDVEAGRVRQLQDLLVVEVTLEGGEQFVVHAALTGGELVAEQIFKTLVLALPKGLAVAVLPVPAKLSLKAAAAALGVAKATMADPADAQRSSGYVLGGISPLGQRRRLPTVLDSSALGFDEVLFSAGKRGMSLAVAPDGTVVSQYAGVPLIADVIAG